MRNWKGLLLLLCAVALLSLDLAPALAQETVPGVGGYYPMSGNRKIEGNLWVTGTTYAGSAKTDWVRFLPADKYCRSDTTSAAMIPVRVSQFIWALQRTGAGAETYNIACDVGQATRTAVSSGYKLTSVNIHYQVLTAALTTHTWGGIRKVVYANGADPAITAVTLSTTPTLDTAVTASPVMTSAIITTPAFVNAQEEHWLAEWSAVLASTGVYRVYGISLGFTRAD